MTDDLVAFIRARLDEDELWAREASRADDDSLPGGGVRWQWVDIETDEPIAPDVTDRYLFVDGETPTASLRSSEDRPLQNAIYGAEQITSGTAAHIVRHDPARVLRDVAARRAILEAFRIADVSGEVLPDDRNIGEADGLEEALRHLAAVYEDHPDYQEAWKP